MYITRSDLDTLPFQSFQKKALVRARPLTQEDYTQRQGIISTLEGPVAFQPGDYLARGIQDEEWPISRRQLLQEYERVSEPDDQGFALYRVTAMRQACQIPKAFAVKQNWNTVLQGKAGDYLVRSGESVWITDRQIFESSYEQTS